MNLIDVNEYLKDDEKAFSFLIKHKLIDNERKCYSIDHECNMFLIKHNQAKGGFLWKCPICSSTRTIFKESIFEDSKFTVQEVLITIYCWVFDFPRKVASKESNISSNSVSAIYGQMKNACNEAIKNSPRHKIGGFQKTIEIDETLLSKRKYQRGRILNDQWVMGGICREDNSIFLELIPNRTSNSLMLSIYNSVEYGSSIITDLWKGYLFLDIPEFPEAYGHATVNHSTNFIDPETGANTQRVERLWREFKEPKKKAQGIPKDKLDLYVSEFLWKREQKLQRRDIFIASCELLSQIRFKK